MKKLLLFAVVVGALAFTSCSKDECECTVNGQTSSTKDVDKDECDAADAAAKIVDANGKCEMK